MSFADWWFLAVTLGVAVLLMVLIGAQNRGPHDGR
jgi:hypothetical protein